MVIDFYNRNGGGGGGTADYATRAGESNKTKLLEGGSALPQSANTGDVVAVAPTPTRGGAKSGGESLGIYQFDGSDWNKIEGGEGGDNSSLTPTTELPEDPVDGEIVLWSEEAFIDYKPEAPDGHTVYGGNLADFMDAIDESGRNELWVKTWDDAGHTERTDQGYFHIENGVIDYYDYQGEMEYLYDDLNEGEWVDANCIFMWKEGKNLYFYVRQEAEGVFFPDTQSSMEFETVVTNNTVNQHNEGVGWSLFPQALYGRGEFPKVAEFGDVVGLGKYEERDATSADVFTSATVTMVNGRATFKMYNPNYGGYCDEYTFGYDENEGIIGGWGGDNNVINGPWNDHGVEFSINGDDITFTSQNPDDTEEALLMWGFDPNCNDRIITKELGIYQRDEDGWNRAVTSNSINSIVKLTQAEYDALVSGGTVDENTFYLIVAEQPQPQPQSLGVWSDDGNGTYTFQMLDTDPASWDSATQIGQLLGISWPYASSDPIDMNVYLSDYNGSWEIAILVTEGRVSDPPLYYFADGTQDEWDTGLRTSEVSSESNIKVSWDGTDTFTFYSGDSDYPLSMNTIDPSAE